MALVLKIVDANGVARTVQAKPGERIAIRRGDTVTVVEGGGVRVEREGNDLVIVYAEGRVVLEGFFPPEPGSVPGPIAAPAADAADAALADAQTTFIFENSDGLNVVTPLGSQLSAGGTLTDDGGGPLPESFALPENAPRGPLASAGNTGGGTGGGGTVLTGATDAPGATDASGPPPPPPPPAAPDTNPPPPGGGVVPSFSFEVASVETREGGELVFTVARSGGTDAAAVTITTANGTAIRGEDFTGYSTGVLSFGADEMSKTITISALPDNVLEGTESFRITLSNPTNGAELGSIDNSQGLIDDPTFRITANSDGTAGEGGTVVFTVTREGDAPGPQTVEYTTFNRTATTTGAESQGRLDYTPTSGTLTFSQGETSRTITVAVTDDALFDHTVAETFGIALSNAAATGATIEVATAFGTITDNDAAPTFRISTADPVDVEGGSTQFTVTRTGDAQRAQVVDYETNGITASAGSDFVAASGAFTFLQGETQKTFTVQLTPDDTVFEVPETFRARLTGTNFGSITTANATATITDDDAVPAISIQSAAGDEGGNIVFKVTRDLDAGTTQTVTVATQQSGSGSGVATANVDYNSTATVVTFNPGQLTRTFTVTTREDTLQDGNEVFAVVLQNPTGGAVLGDASAIGVIRDDDITSYSVDAGAASEGSNGVVFTVSRTVNAGVTQTVVFTASIAGGDTASAADFAGGVTPEPVTLQFNPGQMSKNVTVGLDNDSLFESTERFTVRLTGIINNGPPVDGTLNGASIGTGLARGTIFDNEAAPRFDISGEAQSESADIVFTVQRNTADVATTQTVVVTSRQASSPSASAGPDFTATSTTLTFVEGDASKTFTVAVTDDTRFEADETFIATLSGATGGATIGTGTAVGTIINDDAVPSFSIGDASVLEGDSGTTNLVFNVIRSGDAQGNQTVVLLTNTDGDATPGTGPGTDFTPRSASTLTFSAGEVTETFTVAVRPDGLLETDETVHVTLVSSSGSTTIDDALGIGTILNDDATPSYSIANVSRSEGVGLVFSVNRTDDSQSVETIEVMTSAGGTATEGADYSAATATLTFNPGDTSHTFTVPVNNDSVFEPNETVVATLANPTGVGYTPGITDGSATGTITDNDRTPAYRIEADTLSASEGGELVFNVIRSGIAQGDETIVVSVSGGSAEAGSDYTATAVTLTFTESGDAAQSFTVPVTDDSLFETNETVIASLSEPTGQGYTPRIEGGGAATGTIISDDALPSYSISDASVIEGNTDTASLVFNVTRTGDAQEPETIVASVRQHGTAAGNASAGADFTVITTTLTFTQGETAESFTVPVTGDFLFEGDETLTAFLSGADGDGYTPLIGDATAVGTIQENEPAPTFSINSTFANEGLTTVTNATLTFTVTRDLDSAVPVTVQFSTVDDTASAGVDYNARTGTLTFAPGDLTQTFTVTTRQDGAQEGDQYFLAVLHDPSEGSIGAGTGIGTIVDDDIPSFSVSDATAVEGDNLVFEVTRSLGSDTEQTVVLNITAGSATAGTDFDATPTLNPMTLTFGPAAGATTVSVTVATNGDALFEGNETVVATLSDPTLGTNITDRTGIGTITDNNTAPSYSISDASVSEGNAGTANLVFTVTRSGNSQATETIVVSTNTSGSANSTTATSDFNATVATLTFTQDETAESFTVPVFGDTVFENPETVVVTLSNATSSSGTPTIEDALGTGTILNDDAFPTYTLNAPAGPVNEGGALVFTVTRSGTAQAAETVVVATVPGSSATSNADFTATVRTLTFGASDTAQSFTVTTLQDTLFEGEETVSVSITSANPNGAPAIAVASAVGTILSDDAAPSFSIGNATVSEGNAGTTNLVFNVTRSGNAQANETITVSVGADGTAEAGSDFTAPLATLTFSQGQTNASYTVQVSGDAALEGNETVLVTLSGAFDPNGAPGIATAVGTGTILNDEGIPSYSIAPASASEGVNLVFNVTRNGDSQTTETIVVSTRPVGTAVEGADYTATVATLTFTQGETVESFTVPVTDDTLLELNETLSVSLSGAASQGSYTPGIATGFTQATGTILNNDASPTFSIADVSVSEGNSGTTSLVFNVIRSGDSQVNQTVLIATNTTNTPGSANGSTATSDFTPRSTATLTFSPGETTESFTVTVHGDTVFEGPETMQAVLSATLANAVATIATGTILEDDPAPIYTISNPGADEGDVLSFTVTRDRGAQSTQLVLFSTGDGTAESGGSAASGTADYTPRIGGTLTFAPTQLSQTFTVASLEDSFIESTVAETFNVVLSGAAVGTPVTGTGSIGDDDRPVYSIRAVPTSVVEGNSGTREIEFTVSRTSSGESHTVQYATANGTATASVDYGAQAGTLTFGASALTATFTVSVNGDALFEANETLSASISNVVGGFGGNISQSAGTAFATITNDDLTPSFSVVAAPATAEELGDLVFTVTRTGNAEATLTVTYTTVDGTAVTTGSAANGTFDYVPASGTLTFAPGVFNQTVTVDTVDDTLYELSESFTFSLTGASGGATIGVATAGATIHNTATNDPVPAFSISGPAPVAESAGEVVFTVHRANDSQMPQSVVVGTVNGTAAAGSDYVAATATLVFNAGVMSQTFTVALLNDVLFEGATPQSFSVALSNPQGDAVLGAPASAVAQIIDDESAPSFSIGNAIVTEGNAGTANLVFTVVRSGAAQAQETIVVSTAGGGTAAAGTDFSATLATLTFAAGGSSTQSQTFTVQVLGDTVLEANETVNVTLSGATDLNGTPSILVVTGTGTILNNDNPPSYSLVAASASEGTNLVFNVVRSGMSQTTETVVVATGTGGTAVAGTDYSATVATLTFTQGETVESFTVPVIDDTIFENPNETVSATLTATSGEGYSPSIAVASVTGTIVNNDSPPTFSFGASTVVEGNSGTSNLVFNVIRSGDSSVAQTVLIATTASGSSANGTTATSDYTPRTTATLTFSPGETSETFTVTVLGDTVFEGNETVSAVISATLANAVAVVGAGTILEDDPTPTFSISDAATDEGGGLVFTVTRSSGAQANQVIQFATANGSAVAALDYTQRTGSLTFTPTQLSQTFTVPTLEDDSIEGPETFSVVLSGAPIGTPITGTGTIGDDDIPAFSINSPSVAEGSSGVTNLVFTVLRDKSGEQQTVRYTTAGGTATPGQDYTAASGTLTFVANGEGSQTQTFTVAVSGDTVFEANETVFAVIAIQDGGLNGGNITSPTGIGTITNDDITSYSIGTASVSEGDAGTVGLVFNVTRSGSAQATETIVVSTNTSGSANSTTATSDFSATVATLTFLPTDSVQSFTVPVLGDTVFEGHETVVATLSNVTSSGGGAPTISVAVATGTILNDDAFPTYTLNAPAGPVNEGGALVFNVTRSGTAQAAETVVVATVPGGSATSNADFTATVRTLTFGASDTAQSFTVTTLQDTLFEGEETVSVSITSANPNGAPAIAVASAVGTILSDDAAPSFSIGNATVNEGTQGTTNLVFNVTRSGNAQANETITVSVGADGTAEAGSDFTAPLATLTFSQGQTSATYTVQVSGDTTFEATETVRVTLSGAFDPNGAPSIATAVGTGTIVNDDGTPSYSIAAVPASAAEDLDLVFNVTRNRDSQTTETIVVSTGTDGTAVSGGAAVSGNADFTAETRTLTFTPGELQESFTVTVSDDTLTEGSETVNVTLSGADSEGSYTPGITTTQATGTILNNDASPTFTIANASVSEGNAGTTNLVFNVIRSGDSQAAQTVVVSTAPGLGGSANSTTATSDYATVTRTLTFSAGEVTESFTVAVTGDTIFEGDETLFATLSSAPGSITTSVATGTIINDDPAPSLTISAANATEGSTLSFLVTRDRGSQQTQTVVYTVSDGSAAAGTDYSITPSTGTLTFTPTGPNGLTITVNGVQDISTEGNETFSIVLSDSRIGGAPGGIIADATGEGTIFDDDVPSFSINATATASEGGNIVFTVTRDRTTNPGVSQTVVVSTVAPAGGDTAAANDFAATVATLTFESGDRSQTFTVPVVSDTLFEANETFRVTLGGAATSAGVTPTIGVASQGTATIDDDDATPTFAITAATGQVSEGAALTFEVRRNGAAQATQIVVVSSADGSATVSSGDYATSVATFTFTSADPAVATRTFSISTGTDAVFEHPETVQANLTLTTAGVGGTVITPSATGTIDNTGLAPSLAINPSVSVTEGAGVAVFTVTRTGNAQQTQTVVYQTVNDTAIAGGSVSVGTSDYTTITSTLTFNPGQTNRTLSVAITNDTVFESTESFTVTLSDSRIGGIAAGSITAAIGTATIADNDTAPSFSITGGSVAEGGNLVFTITRTGNAQATQTVTFNNFDGTAAQGQTPVGDYTPLSQVVQFDAGDTVKTVTVATGNDATFEGTTAETVIGSLSAASPFGSITAASATGSIVDNDATPVFSVIGTTNTEDEALVFTVERNTGDVQNTQTVLVAPRTGGTATTPADFSAATATLTFLSGETSHTYTVAVTDDTIFEANETVIVTLSGATGGAVIGGAGFGTATGTIQNNDASPTFAIADASVAEGNAGTASLVFNVTRSDAAQVTQTVLVVTGTGGSANGTTATSDYTPRSTATLTFSPGETTETFTVSVAGDATFEPNETVVAVLTNPADPASITRTTGEGTIVNDEATPTFSIGTAFAAEGGNLVFSVTRSTSVVQDTQTVVVTTADDTAVTTGSVGATDGTYDYTPATRTLTFVNGTVSQTFTVAAGADTVTESNETLHAVLSDPTGGAALGAVATGIGTISDPANVSFSITATAARTESLAHVFTVVRTGPSPSSAQTVVVSTANGTAVAGGTTASGTADYTPQTAVTLTFAASGANEMSRTITVAVADDTVFEANETFSASIVSVTGGGSANPAQSTATATILNNDATPTFSIAGATVSEGAGFATFTVTRSTVAVALTQTITFTTSGGTATAGSDYTTTTGTLTFLQGDRTKSFTVGVLEDALAEGNHAFGVTISPLGGEVITTSTAQGTITDNDGNPTVSVITLGTMTGSNGLRLLGVSGAPPQGGDLTGVTVSAAGDVNRDGFADMIVGAPQSSAGTGSFAGQAYIVYGNTTGTLSGRITTVNSGTGIDLGSLDGLNTGYSIASGVVQQFLGATVGGGDVNGDGHSDVFTTTQPTSGANPNFNRVNIVLGDQPSDLDLLHGNGNVNDDSGFDPGGSHATTSNSVGVIPDADALNRRPTTVSSAGDVDGDGRADILLGLPDYNTGNGEVFLIFGNSATALNALDDGPNTPPNSILNDTPLDGNVPNGVLKLVATGVPTATNTGRSVSAAGDVNGDGLGDLVIGAVQSLNQLGRAYVVFGGREAALTTLLDNPGAGTGDAGNSTGFNLNNLTGANGGFIITHDTALQAALGSGAANGTGLSVGSAGDFNGDGYEDLIIGVGMGGFSRPTGAAYIVYGKDSGFGNISLATLGTDVDGSDGFAILGWLNASIVGSRLGTSVAGAGDVNGDGYDDVIIGAPGANEAYLLFGASTETWADRRTQDVFGADPEFGAPAGAGYDFAFKVATTRFDAAHQEDPPGTPYGTTLLDGTNGVVLRGSGDTGRSVSAAGDVNGDGYADVLVGAPTAVGGASSNVAGEARLVYGSNFDNKTSIIATANPTATADGQTLVGTSNSDTLTSGAGNSDVVHRGGAGNDAHVVNGQEFSVDGGGGFDTLRLQSGLTALDFTAIANTRHAGIERIDLSGNSANDEITLNVRDVLDLSGTLHTLFIRGNATDTVNALKLTGDQGWVRNSAADANDPNGGTATGGVEYEAYDYYAGTGAGATQTAVRLMIDPALELNTP